MDRNRHRPLSFSQKFWEDRHGNFVVWQKPNIWLWTWFVTMVLGWFLSLGTFQKIVGFVSLIALAIWALLELFRGADYFRRLLGLLVLLMILLARV